MRILLALLLLAGLAPLARAQSDGSVVDVLDATLPPVLLVDHPFEVTVTAENKATSAKTVNFNSFLYKHEDGKTCGNQADPRFLGLVSRGAGNTNIPAKTRISFPAAGSVPWYHEVNASQAKGPGTYDVCVFAYDSTAAAGIFAYDFLSRTVELRVENRLPDADFAWSPDVGNVTTLYRFTSSVGDDPDGDTLSLSWEFGHLGPKGRAVAEGAVVDHVFYHGSAFPRTYEVNLTVHDGFGSIVVRKQVVVQPEGVPAAQRYEAPAEPPWWRALPAPGPLSLLAAVTLFALARQARSR